MTAVSTIKLSDLSKTDFVARYGGLYEHSPWIAASAWSAFADQTSTTLATLRAQFKTVVQEASKNQQLDLLRAHPELAGKAAVNGDLTAESTQEQSSARLDLCTQKEFNRFQELNKQYNEKFGFPFILAVRGRSRAEVLAAFEERVNNNAQVEFETALEQVHQIASLRLEALHSTQS